MILINQQKVNDWLKSIGQNQSWLSFALRPEKPYTKSYISQIMSNRCQISRPIIEGLLRLSHASFENLFFRIEEDDTRRFYGTQFWFREKMISGKDYDEEIKKIIDQANHKNNLK